MNLSNIYYKDSMQPIDWTYYPKFYPEKVKAIKELRLDTGLSLKDAKEVIEEIFARLERGEVAKCAPDTESPYQKPEKPRGEGLKKAGKVGGGCLFFIVYIIFGVIFSLTGRYSRKRR